MRFIDEPSTEVTLTMRAPIEAIWQACIDPTLPVENSPELVHADWDHEGPPPGLGARLLGTSRMGANEWSTVANVVEWAPPFGWSFEVGMGADPVSRWWYRLVDHEDGTVTVSQSVRLGPGKSGLTAAIEGKPQFEEEIIAGRLDFMAKAMRANLETIETRAAF